nr:F-box protein At5g49610-like isoform X2 [Ipomoea trifida]
MDLRNLPSASNSELLMDLKYIIKEHALPFLPAKSLFRFLVVCRDWMFHILTPSFQHNQSLCCRGISGLFCQTSGNRIVFVPIHPESCGVPDPSLSFLPEPVVIKASSNGLLCCQGRNGKGNYYLCNPATQQWKKLPKPSASHGSEPELVLIFEPSLLNPAPEYKLICAFEYDSYVHATQFEIYSSRNNSWDFAGEIGFGVKKADLGSGVHVNGVVYWPVETDYMLSFDLTKDKPQLLYTFTHGTDYILGTFDGRLCKVFIQLPFYGGFYGVVVNVLVNIQTNTDGTDIVMWKSLLGLHPDGTHIPLLDIVTTVVAVSRDIVVVKNMNEFYSFDFEHQETKTLLSPPQPVGSYYVRWVPYVNSLVWF